MFLCVAAEGLNDTYDSKAMKEQLIKRTPGGWLNIFLQVYFSFGFLILSLAAHRLELLIANNPY